MAQAKLFTHPRFEDDKKQIRLLRFRPREGEDHTHPYAGIRTKIDLEISICDLSAAPAFNAISYTWGGPMDAKYFVRINRDTFAVRRNCHYALWQARLHYPDSFVWVDAICIDQDSLNEKGHQVLMMGDIFAKAVRVLACVGGHDDSSEVLVRDAANMDELDTRAIAGLALFNWKATLDVRTAVDNFFARPYWMRIWVVQELAVAQQRIVLCGNSQLSRASVHRFVWNLQPLHTARWTWYARPDSVALEDVGGRFAAHDCFDVRDKIYGLLRIIRWPRGADALIPDYGISRFTLVARLMSLSAVRTIQPHLASLVQLLQLGIGDDGFQEAVSKRIISAEKSTLWNSRRVMRPFSGFSFPQPFPEHTFSFDMLEDCESGLRCPALYNAAFQRRELSSRIESSWACTGGTIQVLYDRSGAMIAGFLCLEARSGDYLLNVGPHWLVIRHRSSNTFRIVGQAELRDTFNRLGFESCHVQSCDVRTNLDDEDILGLVYQDYIQVQPKMAGASDHLSPSSINEEAHTNYRKALFGISDSAEYGMPLIQMNNITRGNTIAPSEADSWL